MVVLGRFSVELVEAETERPFPEHHGNNGEFYAEVEPGVEYYVQVAVLDEQTLGEEGCSKAFLTCRVDGIDLGYHKTLGPSDGLGLFGTCQRENGIRKIIALRFSTPRVSWETQTG
jgi:hypothetical protein